MPPTTAVLRVFAAYAARAGTAEEREKERGDVTVYHAGDVTESSGRMDTQESGTLAALRGMLGGVGEVLAQMPGGRFAIGKRAEEGDGELYALTARREASLTDAERVVREFALLRPEFST